MDKDRDRSRDVSSEIPKKTQRTARVGVFGGVILAGSAALIAACGGSGRGEKSDLTPNQTSQAIAGAKAQPSTGPEGVTVIGEASPTVVSEAPTATVEAQLTPEQLTQAKTSVAQTITTALEQSHLTPADLNKAHDSNAHNEMLDPKYLSQMMALCDPNRWGETFGPPEEPRQVPPTEGDYFSVFLTACNEVANISKVLYEATGNPDFKTANANWKPVHKQIFDEIRAKAPDKVTPSLWTNAARIYYLNDQ